MYSEVAWVLVSSGTQVQPQVILDPDYLPDYLSVSYGYGPDHHLPPLEPKAFKDTECFSLIKAVQNTNKNYSKLWWQAIVAMFCKHL